MEFLDDVARTGLALGLKVLRADEMITDAGAGRGPVVDGVEMRRSTTTDGLLFWP